MKTFVVTYVGSRGIVIGDNNHVSRDSYEHIRKHSIITAECDSTLDGMIIADGLALNAAIHWEQHNDKVYYAVYRYEALEEDEYGLRSAGKGILPDYFITPKWALESASKKLIKRLIAQ